MGDLPRSVAGRFTTHAGCPGAPIASLKADAAFQELVGRDGSGSDRTDPLRARWEDPVFAHSGRLESTFSGHCQLR
jgi:hypothetical protein